MSRLVKRKLPNPRLYSHTCGRLWVPFLNVDILSQFEITQVCPIIIRSMFMSFEIQNIHRLFYFNSCTWLVKRMFKKKRNHKLGQNTVYKLVYARAYLWVILKFFFSIYFFLVQIILKRKKIIKLNIKKYFKIRSCIKFWKVR